jgi:hypothetical protein
MISSWTNIPRPDAAAASEGVRCRCFVPSITERVGDFDFFEVSQPIYLITFLYTGQSTNCFSVPDDEIADGRRRIIVKATAVHAVIVI